MVARAGSRSFHGTENLGSSAISVALTSRGAEPCGTTRSNRLVDRMCDDQKTHSDYMAEMVPPRETPVETEQPVTCQGPAVDDTWYGGLWNEMEWYGKGDPCERKD